MSLPLLPEPNRNFLCTKCGSREHQGNIKDLHPPCAKCGYLGFASDVGYTADQMREYGQQCREAALLEACEHLSAFGFPGAASEVESLKGTQIASTLAFAPFDARDDLK